MRTPNPDALLVLDRVAWDVALARTRLRTNVALAEATGISRSRIYAIRSGYIPPAAARDRIAHALDTRASDLWREVRPTKP